MMNPPFALKETDEAEIRFVEHALDQLQENGLLFSVLPFFSYVRHRNCHMEGATPRI